MSQTGCLQFLKQRRSSAFFYYLLRSFACLRLLSCALICAPFPSLCAAFGHFRPEMVFCLSWHLRPLVSQCAHCNLEWMHTWQRYLSKRCPASFPRQSALAFQMQPNLSGNWRMTVSRASARLRECQIPPSSIGQDSQVRDPETSERFSCLTCAKSWLFFLATDPSD